MLRTTVALIVLMAEPLLLGAHEVTLFPQDEAGVLHVTARYGDPEAYEEIARIKLLTLDAIDPLGAHHSLLTVTTPASDGKSLQSAFSLPASLPSGSWILSSHYDNGFFVHDAEGHALATTLEEFPAARDSAHYFKFSKALWRVGHNAAGYDRILGDRLELIPRSDPYSKTSSELLVEIRFEGQPLSQAEIEVGDDTTASRIPVVKSDQHGIARVPLDHKGWYRIAVTHRVASAYPRLFREDDLTASLVFSRP